MGSIQYTNDIDVHIALITAPSYAKQRAERYYTSSKTNHQTIREYVDLFGFMAKNPNAMDIMIEETKSIMKLWGSPDPNFLLTNSKLTFQMTMNPEKTSYVTQGIDGIKRLRTGPNINSYRGLSIINSRSFEMETGAPPRDVLRRRVRVGEYYRIPYENGVEEKYFSFYDESKDAWQKFSWHQLAAMARIPEVEIMTNQGPMQWPNVGKPTIFPFLQAQAAVGGRPLVTQSFFPQRLLNVMHDQVTWRGMADTAAVNTRVRAVGGANPDPIAVYGNTAPVAARAPWTRMVILLNVADNQRTEVPPLNEAYNTNDLAEIRDEILRGVCFGVNVTSADTIRDTYIDARNNFYKYLEEYLFELDKRRYIPKVVRDFFYLFRWSDYERVRVIIDEVYNFGALPAPAAAAPPNPQTNDIVPYVLDKKKIELVVIRPNIEHNMLGIIMGRGGIDELGATLWGQTELSCYDDSMHGIWGMVSSLHYFFICLQPFRDNFPQSYKYKERVIFSFVCLFATFS